MQDYPYLIFILYYAVVINILVLCEYSLYFCETRHYHLIAAISMQPVEKYYTIESDIHAHLAHILCCFLPVTT